jgi:hypothetical protein
VTESSDGDGTVTARLFIRSDDPGGCDFWLEPYAFNCPLPEGHQLTLTVAVDLNGPARDLEIVHRAGTLEIWDAGDIRFGRLSNERDETLWS